MAAAIGGAALIYLTVRSGPAGSPSPGPSAAAASATSAPGPSAGAIAPPVPETRNRVVSAYDPARGVIVIFGGIGEVVSGSVAGIDALSDTWTFDGRRWTQRHPAASPGPRWGAVMAFDVAGGRLLLFGGTTQSAGVPRVLGDTWSWDGSRWSPLDAPNLANAEAVGMAGGARGQPLVLVTREPSGPGTFQTWTWSGTAWHLEHPASGTPSIRLLAGDPVRPSVVAIAVDPQSPSAATWLWNGQNWAEESAPPPELVELFPALAADPAHGEVVLVEGVFFVGAIPQGGSLVWNGDTWIRHPSAVPDHLLNLSDTTEPVLAPGPGGRLFMVGGDSGDEGYRRAWTWDGTTWHPAS